MIDSIFFDDIYKQFSWYDSLFTPVVENCSKEFFFDGLDYKLVSISTNMNILAQNDTFFVTKVKINSKNDIYIRISQEAINVILDKVLGKNNRKFELTEVSELEAKIITAFNDFLYDSMKDNFQIEPYRRYNEIIHLTYYVKSEISDSAAKFIISLPKDILSPKTKDVSVQHFSDSDFIDSLVEASFIIGTTSFPVADIKRLEAGDVVVFDRSNSSEMTLIAADIRQKFRLNPNAEIVESYDAASGFSGTEENMGNSNLWDSIQVDMSAEFDKVKVPLGELKSIEEGLIVDLSSVYDNKISLKVGGKLVATGSLVIINDRFGVRVEHVSESNPANGYNEGGDSDSQNPGQQGEDFDYSDFEVEEPKG